MNINNNISMPGLNFGQTRTGSTTPRTPSGKSFGAQLQDSFERRAADAPMQDAFVRTEPHIPEKGIDVSEEISEAEQTAPDQEEEEKGIVLKREDPEIQAVLDKMVDGKVPLTEEQLAYLAGKYDATNMTGEEYESFADELKDMGILGEFEREAVHGEEPRMARLSDYHGSEHYPRTINEEDRLGFGVDFSEGWGGNALAWVKYHSGERSWYDDIGDYDRNWSSSVFSLVYSVLEQMDALGKDSACVEG